MDPHGAPRQQPQEHLDPVSTCGCAVASIGMFWLAHAEAMSDGSEGEGAEVFGVKLLRFGPRIWMPALYLVIALALAGVAVGSFRQLYSAARRPKESPSERIRATLAAARAAKSEQAGTSAQQPAEQPQQASQKKKRSRAVRPGRAAAAAAVARRRPATSSPTAAAAAAAQPWDGGGSEEADDGAETPWASEELEVGDDVCGRPGCLRCYGT